MQYSVQNKKKEIEFWNNISNETTIQSIFPEERWEIIISRLTKYPKNSIILEVGAGEGLLAKKLADFGFTTIAVDISRDILKLAEGSSNLHRIIGDAENGPYRNKTFDAVVMYGVLHHFPSPFEIIRDLSRVGKNESILLTVEPNANSPYTLLKNFLKSLLIGSVGKEWYFKKFRSTENEKDHKVSIYINALIENGYNILELSTKNVSIKNNFSGLSLKKPFNLIYSFIFLFLNLFSHLISKVSPLRGDNVLIVAKKNSDDTK